MVTVVDYLFFQDMKVTLILGLESEEIKKIFEMLPNYTNYLMQLKKLK